MNVAALERVTPPALAVLNQLHTSDDFKALRANPPFQAIVTKLMPCQGLQYKEFDFCSATGRSAMRRATSSAATASASGTAAASCSRSGRAREGSGSSFNVYDQQTTE